MGNSDGESTSDYVRKLKKKRDSAARRIIRIANNLENVSAVDINDASIDAARIDRDDLEKCFSTFEDAQNEIEEDTSGDELTEQEAERIRVEEIVRSARVSASNFIRRSTVPEVKSASTPLVVTTSSSKIKRPEIVVPKFNGDVKRWVEFKNVFQSLVIDEKTYTEVEKMIYLKQAVEDKAAAYISNFEISRENFAKAWEKLRLRCENRRAVISNYLESLCKLPIAKTENEVAPLLDAATEAIESLNSVGVENGWELMLCHLVAGKLDKETRKQWELSIVGEDEYPSYSKLEKFLQHRVRVFESIAGPEINTKATTTPVVKKDKPSPEKSKTLLIKEKGSSSSPEIRSGSARLCYECGAANHSIVDCKVFLAKNLAEKTMVVQKRGLCFNCLNRGHRVSFCRFKHCEKCDKRHHVLLHREENAPRESPRNPVADMSNNEKKEIETTAVKVLLADQQRNNQIILPAAIVYVYGRRGKRYLVRAFLDSCGGVNVISESLAKKLNCKVQRSNVSLSTLMPGEYNLSLIHVNLQSRRDLMITK